MSAATWRWDCCALCEASGGDWMHSCAQEDNSSACTALNHSSCEITMPSLSLVVQLRTDFSGGGRGIRETTVKKERLILSWFSELNCLTETVLNARACWKEEVLPKVEIWEAEPHPWQQQAVRLAAVFHFWLCFVTYQVTSFPVVAHTLSHLNLLFASSFVSSHVSLLSPPPCQFLWLIHVNPKTWYLQLRIV